MSFQLTPGLSQAEFDNFMKELIDIGGPEVFFRRTNDIYMKFETPFFIYEPTEETRLFQLFLSTYNGLPTDDERHNMVRELLLQIKNLVETTPLETIEGSLRRDAIPHEIDEHIRDLQDERVLQDFEINDMIDHYLDIYPPLIRGEMKRKALWYFSVKDREKLFRSVLSPGRIDVLKSQYRSLYSRLNEDKRKEFVKQLKQKKPEFNIATGGRKRRNQGKCKKTKKRRTMGKKGGRTRSKKGRKTKLRL